MSLRLHQSPASPFVRTTRLAIEELGLADRVTLEAVQTTPLAPDARLLPSNPLGKIPTLARDDGPAMFDSRVICRYLDDLAGGGILYPAAGLWEILTLEALAHGMMEAAVAMIYERRFHEPEQVSEAWIEAQWGKVTRALDAVEGQWLSHLSGRVTAAQIALAAGLGYLDFRHADRDWRTARPGLAGWFEGFAARPSMAATAPPPA